MIEVLDHGYVRLIPEGCWGSDELIIEAARQSTGKGFQGWGSDMCDEFWMGGLVAYEPCVKGTRGCKTNHGDQRLLRYLYTHNHMTPFEMGGLTFQIQAPIFVFREWHRHRTQSYNEMSARYIPLPDVNYIPTEERCLVVNAKNKQANSTDGSEELTHERVLYWLTELERVYKEAQECYELGLKWGIPKELARLPVPVGRYSRMMASANLRNWLAFITLRDSPDAQWEIQQYAKVVASMVMERFPRTYKLFEERKDG